MKNLIFKSLVLGFCSLGLSAFAEDVLQFEKGLEARLTWEQGPAVREESILKLEFVEAATGMPKALDAEVQVELWMPDMGHGSARTRIEVLDVGVYRVTNVRFVMGGVWEVRVQLKFPDGTQEQQVLPVKLESGDGGGHHH